LRACNPAASQSLHSDHCSGHSQRHFELAILGSSIVRLVLLPQHDGRAFFRGYQLTTFFQKVQINCCGIDFGKKFRVFYRAVLTPFPLSRYALPATLIE